MLEKAQILLKQYYGYDEFRPGQAKVISSLLAGKDALAVMPTGAGKSVCFQIPALLLPGITVVVSPLISLMKDQVDSLNNQGIPAAYINSSMTNEETQQRLSEMASGHYKLIYAAPERLELRSFQAALDQLEVSMIAIDEAHCVSQWGHDFRPSYRNISPFVSRLKRRPVIGAFTATATPEVKTDIIKALSLKQPDVYVTGFDRPNLSFSVIRSNNKQKFLMDYVKANARHSGIIYASTRREVEDLYAFLRQQGYAVGRYHAGLNESERTDMQEQFLYDDIRIMVATNAFGMGIDKSNVRYVIHYNMPRNMEAYYQEAGRSGRDGEPGECTLLFGQQDVMIQKFLIEKSVESPERRQHELSKLQEMVDYCYTKKCLRYYILKYFGQAPETEVCDNCGNCTDTKSEEQPYSMVQDINRVAKSKDKPSTRKAAKPRPKEPDEDLFEALRQLRRRIAQREKVPPYVVFADSTLKDMCSYRPANIASLHRIKGVGELKLTKYGQEFLTCIKEYVDQQADSARGRVAKNAASADGGEKKSHLVTLEMFREGLSPQEIARLRGLSLHTLQSHLVKCQREGHYVEWI